MSTTETERYVRITLLTFEGGIWISKKILFREIDRTPGSPTLDALLLSKKRQLTQKRKRREITKRHYETLFPVSGADTDVEEWDLSLLIKMVLFLFQHSLPGQEINDLEEILRIRNEVVCHAKNPSVQEYEFNMHWTQLTFSLSSIASAFDASTKKYASDLVQKLSRGPLDLQSSIERVAQLCRNEEHMLASLSTLQRQMKDVATGVVEANRKLDDVLAGVRQLIRINETDEAGQCRVEIPMLNSTVVLTGKKEDVVKLAENVLRKVLKSAIDEAEDQTDDEKIRDAVQKFLDDIESNGGTADSTESGSIILKIRCETLNGLDSMLSFFRINGRRYRMVGIENALSAMFQEELKVELVLPEDTLELMKTWIDKCLSALSDQRSEDKVQEYKRSINLGIKCDSAEAAVDVIKYLQSGESANRLNQIAEAVSEVVGDKIKIEARPDVDGFSRALRANILSKSESGIGQTSVENEPSQMEIISQATKEISSSPLLPQRDNPVMKSHETRTVSIEEDVQSKTPTMTSDTGYPDIPERRMAQGVPKPLSDVDSGHGTAEDSASLEMVSSEDDATSTSQAWVALWAEQTAVERVKLLKTVLAIGVLINIHRWWIGEISGERALNNILNLGLAVAGGIAVGVGGAAGGGAMGAVFGGPIGAFMGAVAGAAIGYYAGYVSGKTLAKLLTRAIFDLPQSEASEKAYDFLGVSHHASNGDVNSAFRRLSRRYHPDKSDRKEDWTRLQYYMAVIREERDEGDTE